MEEIKETAPMMGETTEMGDTFFPQPPVSPETPAEPEPPKPMGSLFDSITYQRPEDVTIWLEKMNVQDAVFALISAAAYGHKKSIYNLLESEIVSKAIRLITTQRPSPPPMPTTQQPPQSE